MLEFIGTKVSIFSPVLCSDLLLPKRIRIKKLHKLPVQDKTDHSACSVEKPPYVASLRV